MYCPCYADAAKPTSFPSWGLGRPDKGRLDHIPNSPSTCRQTLFASYATTSCATNRQPEPTDLPGGGGRRRRRRRRRLPSSLGCKVSAMVGEGTTVHSSRGGARAPTELTKYPPKTLRKRGREYQHCNLQCRHELEMRTSNLKVSHS
jgi:hypothetical protein